MALQRFFEYSVYFTIIAFLTSGFIIMFGVPILGPEKIDLQGMGLADIEGGTTTLDSGTLTEQQDDIVAGSAPEHSPNALDAIIGATTGGIVGAWQLVVFLFSMTTAWHAIFDYIFPTLFGATLGGQISMLLYAILIPFQFIGVIYLLLTIFSTLRGGGGV